MPNSLQAPTYDDLSQWLKIATAGASTQKSAGAKSATEMGTSGEGTKDPGGYKGQSTHPSARNASNTQAAPLGARAKENEQDNKEDRGPASVDSTSPDSGGSQDDKQIHVGMNPSATGEDPSVEDDYKGDKEDGETTHPADAEDVGEKYSSWDLTRLCKTAEALENNILAGITMGFGFEESAERKPEQKSTKQAADKGNKAPKQAASNPAPVAQPSKEESVEAGYELAAAMGLSKSAADANVTTFLAGLMKEAADDADRVGACLASYYQKEAEGAPEVDSGETHEGQPGHSEPEPSEGPGGEAGEGAIPPELLAAAGGAGGGMGGAPMGAGAGEGGDDSDIQQLAMALMEAGIPPEKLPELIAAAQQGGAGGGGGEEMMPPGGMGGPAPGPEEMGAKIASAVKTYQRSGKFRFTEAKTAEQRRKRNAMKNYILEIAGQR